MTICKKTRFTQNYQKVRYDLLAVNPRCVSSAANLVCWKGIFISCIWKNSTVACTVSFYVNRWHHYWYLESIIIIIIIMTIIIIIYSFVKRKIIFLIFLCTVQCTWCIYLNVHTLMPIYNTGYIVNRSSLLTWGCKGKHVVAAESALLMDGISSVYV